MPTSRRVATVSSTRPRDAELLADQRPGGRLLVGGIDLVERLPGDLVVDALAAQLLGQGPAGQALAGLTAGDPGPGERLVVDQPDLLEPVEQPGGDVIRDVAGGELVAQLLAAARLAGELVEQDLAGDRLGVGLGDLRHRVGRRRTVGRAPGRPLPRRASPGRLPPARRTTRCGLTRGGVRRSRRGGRGRTARPRVHPGGDVADPGRRGPVLTQRVRSHRRPAGPRRRRPRRPPAGRPRASRGSSSRARWPGRGCPSGSVRAFSLPWPSWSPS